MEINWVLTAIVIGVLILVNVFVKQKWVGWAVFIGLLVVVNLLSYIKVIDPPFWLY
jgi:hypothetical protein